MNGNNTFSSLATSDYTITNMNNAADNTWGYSYSLDNGTNWISKTNTPGYSGLPLDNDDNGETGKELYATETAADSKTVKFKIGAKAATTQAAGTYSNVVNFYAVANPDPSLGPVDCAAGKICYNVNSLTPTEGTMGQQSTDDSSSSLVGGSSVTLLASNFSKAGYGFAGWNTSYDYTGTNYGPNETITAPSNIGTNGLSLYAIWVPSAGTMQNWSGCPELGSNQVTALTDLRDNQVYAVAKLADGNCWMIENLRLESTAEHNSDGSLAQGYGTSATYGNFGGLADAESANFTNSTTANSLYYSGTQSGTASIDIGTSNLPGRRMPRYNNINTSTRATNPTNNSGNMYSYGNYYTWHAAMANTTHYSSPTATDEDRKMSDTVNTSLCPTGWRLPYGRDTGNGTTVGGFYNLNYKINSDSNVTDSTASRKLRAFPNNFLYSGSFYASSAYDRGLLGGYWSSTASNYAVSYKLYLYSGHVDPGTNFDSKYFGLSIRCTVGS